MTLSIICAVIVLFIMVFNLCIIVCGLIGKDEEDLEEDDLK